VLIGGRHCPYGNFDRDVSFLIFAFFSGDGSEALDDRTEHWPIKASLQDALNRIKYQFKAVPLPVYVDDRFIKPVDVYEVLKGALVEVQFELHHYRIQKKKFDSFNATVQQVLVLKPGVARPATAFKRHNVEEGPVRRKRLIARADENGAKGIVEEKKGERIPTLHLEIEPPVVGKEANAESSAQGGESIFLLIFILSLTWRPALRNNSIDMVADADAVSAHASKSYFVNERNE
jgi:hypothetical protein